MVNLPRLLTSRTPNIGVLGIMCLLVSCGRQDPAPLGEVNDIATSTDTQVAETVIEYEQFTLDNGLKVILHIDRSDPVVAVVLTAHVGSSREVPGRTGFAHLFEHLLFLESENLGKGGLDAMSARIGGSGANGSTNRDRTNYLQTVPNDALEKMLWAEADKLGWFINTVTEPVLAKEKQVVKNEKRQSYDNQPYGHEQEIIYRALYPQDHPYSWDVIGTLEDIQNATLDDVKTFYQRWYTPDNVTLAIAGDFDPAQARAWVTHYFAEIPAGPGVQPRTPQGAGLDETRHLYYEDAFAQLPQLTMVWPTVPQYHPDALPLQVLQGLLTSGKEAPLNAVLIDEQMLTASVDMFQQESELAGELFLQVRAFDGVDLDTVAEALDSAFNRFETEGVDAEDLARIVTSLEVDWYNSIATVLGKAVNLGATAALHGTPALLNTELDALRAVTIADVMRVYESYVKNQPYISTSFVPAGQVSLAIDDAEAAVVFEEPIIQGAEAAFDASLSATYERTPSAFDRSSEPPYGPTPVITPPVIWENTLDNSIRIAGITDFELPLVQFDIQVEGGVLLEDPALPGTANFLAEILDKGTVRLTAAEFEKALDLLGSSVSVNASQEGFTIRGSTLARNLDATMALVAEMLLQPRWDDAEIELARARILAGLQDDLASPLAIAGLQFARVLYGDGHPFARDSRGTVESVMQIDTPLLQQFHQYALAPGVTSIRLVGAVSQEGAGTALRAFNGWNTPAPVLPEVALAATLVESRLYFFDMPGAAQSVFRFGHPGPLRNDPDYYPLQMLNYRLGGGGFASQLMQELRESKGYTYGINSRFQATERKGEFLLATGVRANVTLEAMQLIRQILADYADSYSIEDIEVSRSYLLKSQARAFESLQAKLGMLGDVVDFDLPHDYIVRQREIYSTLAVDDMRQLANSWLHIDAMHYVVVGDAATQLPRLQEAYPALQPVLLNPR
jgi:zinc protease